MIISLQSRDTSDVTSPIAEKLIERYLGLDGNLAFVCVARSARALGRDSEALVGKVYVFRSDELWKTEVRERIKSLQESLGNFPNDITATKLLGHFKARVQDLVGYLNSNCTASGHFWLLRSGTITMNLDPRQCGMSLKPALPTFPLQRNRMLHALAAQMFYFLRDIGHRHQHHNPRTDTIVSLHPKGNDVDWRLTTLYMLFRKIIRYKRNPYDEQFFNSLGVLAYTKTFREVCRRELGKQTFQKHFPAYYDQNMEQSIHAIQSTIIRQKASRERFQEIILSTLLGTVSFIVALSMVVSVTDWRVAEDPHTWLQALANFVVSQPPVALIVVFALAVASLLRTSTWKPESNPRVRKLLRLVNAFRRRWAIAIFVLLSVGLVVSTWLLDMLLVWIVDSILAVVSAWLS